MTTITETHLSSARLSRRGKVRELYDLGDSLLLVASDRISAFDVVLSPGIPDKGRILTQLSNFWFRKFADVENHLLETDVARFPEALRADEPSSPAGRSSSRSARSSPSSASPAGISPARAGPSTGRRAGSAASRCPSGLREADRLPEPIFTPATKAETGHDENISFETMARQLPDGEAERLRDLTSRSTAGRPSTPRRAASSSPTRSSSSAASTAASSGSTRRSRPTPRATGTRPSTPGTRTGLLRQAVRARLARVDRLGQAAAGAEAARGRRSDDPREIPRRLPQADRRDAGAPRALSPSPRSGVSGRAPTEKPTRGPRAGTRGPGTPRRPPRCPRAETVRNPRAAASFRRDAAAGTRRTSPRRPISPKNTLRSGRADSARGRERAPRRPGRPTAP